MGWRPQGGRGSLRVGTSAVLSGLLALALAGCTGGHGKVETDRSTARAAASALTDAGPAAGTLSESWRVDTSARPGSSISPYLIGGQVVIASADGINAYDATTGRSRWHYHENDRKVTGYAVTPGSLVVMTADQNLDRRTSRWTGLATATGRIAWSERAPGYPLPNGSFASVAGRGVLPLLPLAGGVRGIDIATGRARWTRDVAERGCRTPAVDQLGASDSDGSLFAVKEECGSHARILAVDPATGAVRWAHDLNQRGVTTVREGVTLLDDQRGVTVVMADGHAVLLHRRCEEPCRFAVADGHAVVSSARWTLNVDLPSGKAVTRPLPAPYETLAVADGQVYGIRRNLGEGMVRLLPGALDVIDPPTGTVRTGPAPFALADGDGDAGERDVPWMEVAGGRLYAGRIVAGAYRVTSYATARPGPPAELGGVQESDWPDACAIAPGYKGSAPPPDTATVTIGLITLHHLSCVYRLAGNAQTALDIAWVAPTPEDAHQLLTTDGRVRPIQVAGADEAFTSMSPTVLWLRAGRYVLRIARTDLEAQALASTVAEHLRNR